MKRKVTSQTKILAMMVEFADEIHSIPMNDEDLLDSYDETALFTNVPLSGTVNILVDKALTDDWFNQTYDLNLEKEELAQLLEVATTNQLFQLDGHLYEQTDGVAMGSPLGLLMANVFMCHLQNSSHTMVWCPLCIRGILMILLLECLTPMLLLIF